MGLIEDFIAEHPKEMELAQMRRREVKKLLADYDKTLREQIAREIMAKCRNETKTFDYEGGFITVSGCLECFDNEVWGGFYQATCSHFEDAAIARGEK